MFKIHPHFINCHEGCKDFLDLFFFALFQTKTKRERIFSREITGAPLWTSMCILYSMQDICEQNSAGGWVFFFFWDQNKFYLPRSRDALDFRNVAPRGRETAPSEGRGQNLIVAYGCLLLLLSWIHTQCRHCVRRIGIRGATKRQSRISEHECLMSLLILNLDNADCNLKDWWGDIRLINIA